MAVEIIIQIGDREFWKEYDDMKSYMEMSYQIILEELIKRLPQFVVANAEFYLDEDSPHMHIVGVPAAGGYMNVETKEYYSKETIQWEIKAGNRTGIVERMDANVVVMAKDLQEILRSERGRQNCGSIQGGKIIIRGCCRWRMQ